MKKILIRIIQFPYSLWAFLYFAIVTSFIIFPIAVILTYTLRKRAVFSIIPVYRTWAKIYNLLIFVRIKCYGYKENVQPGKAYMYVGNHGSFMDIMAFGSTIFNVYKPIAKRELIKMPIVGLVFKMACIMVDRSNEASRKRTKEAMRESIEDGVGILVFAEGTRNRTNAPLMPFKDGAFKIAAETGAEIIPFCIINAKNILAPNSFWMRPGTISIYYLPPVKIADFPTYEDLKQFVYNQMEATIVEKSGNQFAV